jgi:hypothetical protein
MDRSRKRIARRRSATGPCRRLIPVCGAASAERAAPQARGSYHERFFGSLPRHTRPEPRSPEQRIGLAPQLADLPDRCGGAR